MDRESSVRKNVLERSTFVLRERRNESNRLSILNQSVLDRLSIVNRRQYLIGIESIVRNQEQSYEIVQFKSKQASKKLAIRSLTSYSHNLCNLSIGSQFSSILTGGIVFFPFQYCKDLGLITLSFGLQLGIKFVRTDQSRNDDGYIRRRFLAAGLAFVLNKDSK